MKQRSFPLKAALAFLTLILGGCATEQNLYTGKTSYYAYSWEKELQIGESSDKQITQQMGIYRDDEIAQYVEDIGQSLLAQSAIRSEDAPDKFSEVPFTFRVLDSDVVNAFALPGGYVYVTRGLLAHVENEAQLAVVIGHEIVHVEARHASKQALKQQLGQIGLVAGSIIGEQFMENKELARNLISASGDLFQLLTLKYGRDAERESDWHGVEYATKAGYAAGEGSAFFGTLKRISDKSGQTIPSWMSSHPDPGEREEKVLELSDDWKSNVSRAQFVGREEYLRMIDGLVVGNNPRNGYVNNGTFYHPELRWQLSVPSGWKTQNESAALYLGNPEGTAMIAVSFSNQSTALAAGQDLATKLSLQLRSSQATNVNGLTAYELEGDIVKEDGSLSVYALFVEYDGNVYGMVGYGDASTFSAYRGSIRSTVNSFQELNNRSILNVQPARLTIAPAPWQAPFSTLLPSELPAGTDAQDWAIMNQVELDQTIEKGRLIKLPE